MMIEKPTVHIHVERIQAVQRYIRDHLEEPLQREFLADIACLSVPQLHRVFTGCVGENVATYVRRIRLERGARKLRMGAVDITEVALAAGYQTHAAFGKAFKKQFGLSPSEFRDLDCRTATQMLRKD
jgi:transcriptional regulator GlxA family with amidase domain